MAAMTSGKNWQLSKGSYSGPLETLNTHLDILIL